MRLIDSEKRLVSKIQLETGCNFITAQKIVDSMPPVQAIPLDLIKQAKEEIDDLYRYYDNDLCSGNNDSMFKCNEVLEILDKLIESEG